VPLAAFSLLDHLDLDITLDEDLSFLEEPLSTDLIASQGPSQTPQILPMPHTLHAQPITRIVLNPKQALFFPLPSFDSKESNKARQRDVYDLIRENGWYWRDPAVRFWNTESEEEIRGKWEASRGELTTSWKQRWREAGKVRRRKKLADGDEQM
jgi:hypothetical protein